MSSSEGYHFLVRVYTDDLAVLHCLRALAFYSHGDGQRMRYYRGTGEYQWRTGGHCVTFRFTAPRYKDEFLRQADRLLPKGSWREVPPDWQHLGVPAATRAPD